MSRILQICTFPTLLPRHGGQRRGHQISRVLEAAGHSVRRIAAFAHDQYQDEPCQPTFQLGDFPIPAHPTTWLFDGVRFLTDSSSRSSAFEAFCEAEPADVLLLEEPWLWPAVRRLPSVASGALPVVYSSYNIETPQFQEQLDRIGHPQAAVLVRELSETEADLAQRAAGCVAVTESDAASLRHMGAQQVVVAPNGVEPRTRAHLKGALPRALNHAWRYVLFVASAHPPNASGIDDLFVPIMESLRPLERVIICGGVSKLIDEWLEGDGWVRLAKGRLERIGPVSDFALDGLIANAEGFVLPLRRGGGSNLKTAEALYSRLPVVATPTAMRGYETLSDLPGLIVAGTPGDFVAGMRRVFDDPPSLRPSCQQLDELTWDFTLRPVSRLMAQIVSAS